ncbi:MAG: oxidoreductase [Planctomycetota bacterium]
MKLKSGMNFVTLILFLCFSAGCRGLATEPEPVIPTWIPQHSGSTASLRGICAVSERIAWASGEQGTCLRTTNGGDTWEAIHVPGADALDFRDIQAWDEYTAIIMAAGDPARIFKTTDCGMHWSETYFNDTPGVFLDAMAFWDQNNGVAFGDPLVGGFLALATGDGGNSWERIPPETLPAPLPGEAAFAASGTCLCVAEGLHAWFGTGGTGSRVIQTADKGVTWESFSAPLICGRPSTGIFSLAFCSAENGVMVGGDYESAELAEENAAWTADSGKSWTLSEIPPLGYRSCVAWVPIPDGQLLIAVGPTGSDYSLDHGKRWKPFSNTGYHSISFNGLSGWASGADGRIAKFALVLPPPTGHPL